MTTRDLSINNPYEPPKSLAPAKPDPDVLRPASCGYTLAVVLLGIVAGVMFIILLALIVDLVFQGIGISFS